MKNIKNAVAMLILLIALVMPLASLAGDFKARAREHIDIHKIDINNGNNLSYSGLSNTINIWWEKPRIYSIGLAFNPIFGSASADNDVGTGLSDKIKLITLGVEGKYYHHYAAKNLFSRFGVGASQLDTNGILDNVDGYHLYVGAGWEFDVNGVGIALEMAFRQSRLSQNIIINSITPSIGVHFYR